MTADKSKRWEDAGLTAEEYGMIEDALGREPNDLELALFSVMWSEHCGYKYSRALLKKLPTTGSQVLQGPGENAGIIDIQDGQAVVMKIESHNHPSAVEPYAGAATGVGGILRDIFTMGARPVAGLNSLRFGPLTDSHQRELLTGAVAGMADYGRTFGIPMIAGEVYFDDSYSENCLVNAMAVGFLDKGDPIAKGIAAGVGNVVMAAGTPTGRDGIEGAAFASVELTEEAAERKAAIPKGYPEMGKRLMEACLEAIKAGVLVGIQDMGAAGLTSSACEMAARGKHGIELDLSLVPVREPDMTPYEIMLSETQERMLFVVKAGEEEAVQAIFDKWDVPLAVIGRVTDDGLLRLKDGDEVVAEVPAEALADAPVYHPAARRPDYLDETESFDLAAVAEPDDYGKVLLKLLGSPNISSREWIFERFDHQVGGNTLSVAGLTGAGVIGIKDSDKAVAFSVDCNSRLCYLGPRTGAAAAVAEAARNLVCTGAKPLAVTDGLNFGSPEKPEIYWQFSETIGGIAEACKKLDTPVIGGNVSFYNESKGKAIYPTPIIGMAGLIDNKANICTQNFKKAGDVIVLLGENKGELGGSEYLNVIHGLVAGRPPQLDLELEKRVQDLCLAAIREGLLSSAHDCSEGGLAVNLAESCILGSLGAEVTLEDQELSPAQLLYGESHSRIVVSLAPEHLGRLQQLAEEFSAPLTVIGKVQEGNLQIQARAQTGEDTDQVLIDLPLQELEAAWRRAIPCQMES
ncbi:MAG: phosphoribosylformylglycinamidine synthase subunit PurL [Firmicutes bacterium]|nr:phosphoribosylformylglycinamidine synthase subunit PurL [Bacillota bacterium]